MNVWLERRSEQHGTSSRGFNSTSEDSQYQRDRARIIHSASFRSLQSKTQVLGLGESDFYRTRLTHSLEVAQVGSGVCEWLREQPDNATHQALIPSFSLIEAVCLAHDIGHSPFGHGGEVAMNTMMRDHGGFEANGQTLRILARLGEYSPESGLDLTRRTMLGTIKYPALYSQVCRYVPVATENPLNIDHWAPPKCIYDAEKDVLDWLLEPFSTADRDRFLSTKWPEKGHGRTQYKSFDTSIMELADDIAYGVHDLEDALALRLVERDAWMEQVVSVLRELPDNPINLAMDEFNQLLFSTSAKDRKHAISRFVGYLIRSIVIEEQSEFEAPLLRLQARMESPAYQILKLIKDFVMSHVIFRPELQMLQYKGQRVVVRLFEIFEANPERLLPIPVFEQYKEEGHRAIADYLSSMTDVSAGKLYHKLLSPTSGSIFDRP
ncbi:anti-phage deoxyguanosine triphosphatase [Granulosicoccus antarcticus]|uniref:Deoxyguanosinetriphosphate triphosphohydrolase-like protein n=1 Tax=Granulosicoccus antarcticus IMCC3135 TaxID=1192854 RepID=A0A2Z2NVJ4_9GAMM|nr:anti-phage deoxyguanosine triphosphatase [Granulosicoccus antarcticus]ASJ71697.1 Deoxyguanosinetriphosphate triphosphohydrolase-like protein [Granulosicoccus antarcticus IMCC3135]